MPRIRRILITGLSGSGKTTLAKKLSKLLNAKHINGDEVRNIYDDWDFSEIGRLRQAHRIKTLSEKYNLVVCDFIAPTDMHRNIINPDVLIWMDTIKSSKYKDTDILFECPINYTHRILYKDAEKWSKIIYNAIKSNINN